MLWELRDATVEVAADSLTEADKLNGVTWRDKSRSVQKPLAPFVFNGLTTRNQTGLGASGNLQILTDSVA